MEKEIAPELERWFINQPKWQQEAARIFVQKGFISDDDYKKLYLMCKNEGEGISAVSTEGLPSGFFKFKRKNENLKLISLSNIKGVNALSEEASLSFDNTLTVVFGQNGTGKTGYVRVLKKICGAPSSEELLPNVYKKRNSGMQSCRLKISINGKTDEFPCNLKEEPSREELLSINVYDTATANLYFSNDNKAKYEPPVLLLFEELAELCLRIRSDLDSELKASKRLKVPDNIRGSMAGQFYINLSYKNQIRQLDLFPWNEELERTLQDSLELYYKTDIDSEIKKRKEQINYISQFLNKTENYIESLSDEKLNDFKSALIEMNSKKKTAYIAAEILKKESSLDGVGLESWKDLWRAAKKYSEEYAYRDSPFPVLAEDSVCVLCQQPLSHEAKSRFLSFQEFILSDTEIEANKAQQIYENLINDLPDIESVKLSEFFLLGNIQEKDRATLEELYSILSQRKDIFKSLNIIDEYLDDVNLEIATSKLIDKDSEKFEELSINTINTLYSYLESINVEISKLKELDSPERKKALLDHIITLEGQKWIYDNKKDIKEELTRITNLERAKKLTSTNRISKKKSEITELYLTENYVKNFNDALNFLGAKHLNVKLISKTVRGKLINSILLENTIQDASITKVLSEGEQRVVSLSAFIADALSSGDSAPFIFDDPMSSLDHLFENATANFLIELCKERQVIVFTHRLTFLKKLSDIAEEKEVSAKFIELYSFRDQSGIIDDLSLLKKKSDKIINALRNDYLPKAKREWENRNIQGYEIHASYICRCIRISLEIIIERVLLSNVITRFKPEVTTKKVLIELSKIEEADCQFIEGLMKKYSFALHSQSFEQNYKLPDPDEIENDLREISEWITEFKSRG